MLDELRSNVNFESLLGSQIFEKDYWYRKKFAATTLKDFEIVV